MLNILPAPRTFTRGTGSSDLRGADIETLALKLQSWAPRAARAALMLLDGAGPQKQNVADSGSTSIDHEITARLDPTLGAEAYTLSIGAENWSLRAGDEAGAFWAVQVLRQALRNGEAPWFTCTDSPKYQIRGFMLDIARHFFGVDEIKQVIDLASTYRFNELHLHLTDDQGWRLEIEERPLLTEVASGTDVSGGPGGFLTVAEYQHLQEYAADRHIVIVPEIDLPGHTHAALMAYPEISPDDKVREPFTGVEVGFSSIDLESTESWTFIDDVVGALARTTLGPRIHLGGDEALTLARDEYVKFIERLGIVAASHGKDLVLWQEAAGVTLPAGTLIQYWTAQLDGDHLAEVARTHDVQFIASPGHRTYLDHLHVEGDPFGQTWAGAIDLRQAYEWEPVNELRGIPEDSIAGVEACLWTETVTDFDRLTTLLLPRLPAIAEVAWGSPSDWARFSTSIVAHSQIWSARGLTFHRSIEIDWSANS